MENGKSKTETRRILIFLAITFAITYAYCFGVVWPLAGDADLRVVPAVAVQLSVAAMMFFPAVGVLLTRLITGEGFRNAWLCPHIRGNVKTYLLAWFGPGILTLLGIGVYFLLFPGEFDPGLGYLKATLAAAGGAETELPVSWGVLFLVQAAQGLLLAPVLNFVTCFGEEWGWRGYLLPKMAQKLPPVPMLLVTGVIWACGMRLLPHWDITTVWATPAFPGQASLPCAASA